MIGVILSHIIIISIEHWTLNRLNFYFQPKIWTQHKSPHVSADPQSPATPPKKISLLPQNVGHDTTVGDLSYLQSFSIQGQGFRLPPVHLSTSSNHEQQHILQQKQRELLQKQLQPQHQQQQHHHHHSSPFEGYRKHMPQVISHRQFVKFHYE